VLELNGRQLTPVEQKVQHVIREGDRIHFRTPGGGGFGPPAKRDAALAARDRRDGYTP